MSSRGWLSWWVRKLRVYVDKAARQFDFTSRSEMLKRPLTLGRGEIDVSYQYQLS